MGHRKNRRIRRKRRKGRRRARSLPGLRISRTRGRLKPGIKIALFLTPRYVEEAQNLAESIRRSENSTRFSIAALTIGRKAFVRLARDSRFDYVAGTDERDDDGSHGSRGFHRIVAYKIAWIARLLAAGSPVLHGYGRVFSEGAPTRPQAPRKSPSGQGPLPTGQWEAALHGLHVLPEGELLEAPSP